MPLKSKLHSNGGYSLKCVLNVAEETQFQLNAAENVEAVSLD
jgi:hypothetical protein